MAVVSSCCEMFGLVQNERNPYRLINFSDLNVTYFFFHNCDGKIVLTGMKSSQYGLYKLG